MLIMIVTVAISLFTLYGNQQLFGQLALHPWSVRHSNKWYMLVTSGLIHADLTHLLFNMLTFFFFAPSLEYWIGTGNFLVIYFGSMVLADMTTVYKQSDNPDFRSLGASGAVSGVIFSFILFNPLSKMYIMFLPVGIPAVVFGPLFLLYCWYAARRGGGNINHDAHFGGAIAGLILTIILIPEALTIFFKMLQM